MIHDVAKKLNSVLTPEDLVVLEKAFARVCELRGITAGAGERQTFDKAISEWNTKPVSAGVNADGAKISVSRA